MCSCWKLVLGLWTEICRTRRVCIGGIFIPVDDDDADVMRDASGFYWASILEWWFNSATAAIEVSHSCNCIPCTYESCPGGRLTRPTLLRT